LKCSTFHDSIENAFGIHLSPLQGTPPSRMRVARRS